MFEIGWTEMLVIAVVMIVVVGPKDLPGMLRTFGKTDDEAALDGGRLPEAVQRGAARKPSSTTSRSRSTRCAASIPPTRSRSSSIRSRRPPPMSVPGSIRLKPAPPTAGLSGRGRRRAAQERSGGHARRCAARRLSRRQRPARRWLSAEPVEPAPSSQAQKTAGRPKTSSRDDRGRQAEGRPPQEEVRKQPDVSTTDQDEVDKSSAPLIEHLIELRSRLMWSIGGFFAAFLVCFFFAKQLFNILVIPFKWAVSWAGIGDGHVELIYTAPQEFFFTQIKLAMFGGLVIAFPLIATQIYKFIAPGLYKNERNAFLPFLIASPILFLHGRGARLFLLHAHGDVVLPRHAADRRRRTGADFAAAEGVRISQPHHDADLLLRPGFPASGRDLADGARRHAVLESALPTSASGRSSSPSSSPPC